MLLSGNNGVATVRDCGLPDLTAGVAKNAAWSGWSGLDNVSNFLISTYTALVPASELFLKLLLLFYAS